MRNLLKRLLLATLICIAVPVNADETKYTMTFIVDAAHGDEIAVGDYAAVVESTATHESDVDDFFVSTNLCVAYTKTRNFVAARLSCEAAVELAHTTRVSRFGIGGRTFQVRKRKEYLAIALSNRDVLYAVMSEA